MPVCLPKKRHLEAIWLVSETVLGQLGGSPENWFWDDSGALLGDSFEAL